MYVRDILLGVLASTLAFIILYTLLNRLGLSNYWVLVGAILGALITSRLVDRSLRRRRRR